MSDAQRGSPQSSFLPELTPGSKRKQIWSNTTEVGQLVTESTSKKPRRETSQSPVPCSTPSSEDLDHGKEAEPVTAEPQAENAEAELSASQFSLPLQKNL